MPKNHNLAHDLRNAINNVHLNLEVAQRLASRSTDARAEELRQHLVVAATELQKLKHMIEAVSKDLA
jgi:signal transduction histidine kinase